MSPTAPTTSNAVTLFATPCSSPVVVIGTELHFGGGVDYFIQSVFNYPTLSDVYKYAAFDALGQLNKIRGVAVPGLAQR